jgi:two-component system, OmpR family, alkaline phosphatase synthesis response regulator PhoP
VTKVLVVDDDPDFCEIVSMVLRKEGYEIESASSGDAALRQMRASPPDIVLLDVMMSTVLDGVNVSFAMARDPVLKTVPIVMISSIPDSAHADEFPTDEYVPISAWITKPVQPQQLVNTVKRLAG